MKKIEAGKAARVAAAVGVLAAVSALSFLAGRASVHAEVLMEVAEQGERAVELFEQCEETVGKRCGKEPSKTCLRVVEGTCKRVALGITREF